jgi:predicted esterase
MSPAGVTPTRVRIVVLFLALVAPAFAQASKPAPPKVDDSDPDNPVTDLRVNKVEEKRYFLIGPKLTKTGKPDDTKVPKDGYRLLVVLPGGPGTPDFMPFVRNIRANVLGQDYLIAQLVAVKWTENQTTVWPTKLSPAPKMQFGTDELVAEVIADVAKRHKIDKRYVFALGWSSSGHVIYNLALQDRPVITGAYIAQSVFHPSDMPPIKAAKGRAFFLDHSPEDETCKFKDAETARDALKKAGANVELVTYAGGHGWQDMPFVRMKKGIKFLEDHVEGKKK